MTLEHHSSPTPDTPNSFDKIVSSLIEKYIEDPNDKENPTNMMLSRMIASVVKSKFFDPENPTKPVKIIRFVPILAAKEIDEILKKGIENWGPEQEFPNLGDKINFDSVRDL